MADATAAPPAVVAGPASGLVDTNALVQDIRPDRPPVPIPNPWAPFLWAAVLALLATAAWLAWRRYRRQQRQPPPEIVIPPYRRALEQLRAALDFIHDPGRFVVVVSDALRAYLEERFNLHAPERTTEEFLAEVQAGSVLTPLQQGMMRDFLTRCDLVKFARYEPREPELRELHEAATRLVEETEPLLNPPVAPANPAPPADNPAG